MKKKNTKSFFIPKESHCPFCETKIKSMVGWIMHLYTSHPEYLPKVEDDSFNPSARPGKVLRDLTDEEYIELVKLLRKLEGT